MSHDEDEKSTGIGIDQPHHNDVLCGRGKALRENPGNTYYRKFIQDLLSEKLIQSPAEKRKLSQEVIDHIHNLDPPGRFLEKDKQTELWYEISNKRALEKVKQLVRETLVALARRQLEKIAVNSKSTPPASSANTMASELGNKKFASAQNNIHTAPNGKPVKQESDGEHVDKRYFESKNMSFGTSDESMSMSNSSLGRNVAFLLQENPSIFQEESPLHLPGHDKQKPKSKNVPTRHAGAKESNRKSENSHSHAGMVKPNFYNAAINPENESSLEPNVYNQSIENIGVDSMSIGTFDTSMSMSNSSLGKNMANLHHERPEGFKEGSSISSLGHGRHKSKSKGSSQRYSAASGSNRASETSNMNAGMINPNFYNAPRRSGNKNSTESHRLNHEAVVSASTDDMSFGTFDESMNLSNSSLGRNLALLLEEEPEGFEGESRVEAISSKREDWQKSKQKHLPKRNSIPNELQKNMVHVGMVKPNFYERAPCDRDNRCSDSRKEKCSEPERYNQKLTDRAGDDMSIDDCSSLGQKIYNILQEQPAERPKPCDPFISKLSSGSFGRSLSKRSRNSESKLHRVPEKHTINDESGGLGIESISVTQRYNLRAASSMSLGTLMHDRSSISTISPSVVEELKKTLNSDFSTNTGIFS